MKILLLSVLAVAMIGLMVPSTYAEDEPLYKLVFETYPKTTESNKILEFRNDISIKNISLNDNHLKIDFEYFYPASPDENIIVLMDGYNRIFYKYNDCQCYKIATDSDNFTLALDDDGWLNFLKNARTAVDWDKRHEYGVDVEGMLSDTVIAVFDRDDIGWSLALPVISEPVNEKSATNLIEDVKSKSSEGGGCLIATAAFGSEMAPQVQFLREIRDNTVMSTQSGTAFMTGFNQFYYSFSPAIADYERENPVFKEAVKVTLTPLLTSLTLLNYVDIDTEEEMLGYGIGIVLLNIGMYFVTPAVIIVSLKKRLFL